MSDRIIKIHKRENPYAQIDKDILRNKNLSWKAKGLLAYLLSLPHDWKVHLNEVVKHSTDGATSTRSAFKELRESGYIRKVSTRDDKGQITGWETIVYEVPIIEVKSTDDGETTLSKKPDVENRHSGEAHTTNKEVTNNEKSNKIKTIADTKTVSAHKQIIDHYHNKFLAKYGVKPFINGKTGKDVKGLLSNNIELDAQKVIILLDRYFDDNDDFIVKNRHSFSVFMSRINQLNTVDNTPKQFNTQERGGCYRIIGGGDDPEYQAWLSMQEGE